VTAAILWGSYLDSDSATEAFEDRVGKTMSLVHIGYPWADGRASDGTPRWIPFPRAVLDAHWQAGRLVMLDWGSWDLRSGFSLPGIVRGEYDAYLHGFAQAAASWRHPFMLRFNGEMNGWWQAWSDRDRDGRPLNGNRPGDFVRAWNKVHQIFATEAASNVTWLWCANVLAPPGARVTTAPEQLGSYYPGDLTVDWLGFDTFNWAGARDHPWMSFDQIMTGSQLPGWYGNSYATISALAPTKPMAVCEFACDERGGDKAAWIGDALRVLPVRFPRIRALSWFDRNVDGAEWSLTSRTDGLAVAAFKAAIAAPLYVAGGSLRMPQDLAPVPAFS
jgi:mannan endo-1,4-beta-mannosidase